MCDPLPKNIWFAYILTFFTGGLGIVYLGGPEDKQIGVTLTILAILGWFTVIVWFFCMVVGMYLTRQLAQELRILENSK